MRSSVCGLRSDGWLSSHIGSGCVQEVEHNDSLTFSVRVQAPTTAVLACATWGSGVPVCRDLVDCAYQGTASSVQMCCSGSHVLIVLSAGDWEEHSLHLWNKLRELIDIRPRAVSNSPALKFY